MRTMTKYLEVMRGPAPQVEAEDLHSGLWLLRYARRILLSSDALLFVCSGITVGLLSEYFKAVESNGKPTLLAVTAVGFAALAVALTALTIFVSLVNDAYLRVLGINKGGGMAGYVIPYLSAALVSSIATIVGTVGALAYNSLPNQWSKASLLGLEVGLVVWATWGVFQLIVEVAIHGLNRYDIALNVAKRKVPDISDIIGPNPTDNPHITPP